MTRSVVIRPLAEIDANSVYGHYESLEVGLGERFLRELEQALGLTADHPEMY